NCPCSLASALARSTADSVLQNYLTTLTYVKLWRRSLTRTPPHPRPTCHRWTRCSWRGWCSTGCLRCATRG
ncbi:unnamed protein product, partial [Gadus morhua 'NCC']